MNMQKLLWKAEPVLATIYMDSMLPTYKDVRDNLVDNYWCSKLHGSKICTNFKLYKLLRKYKILLFTWKAFLSIRFNADRITLCYCKNLHCTSNFLHYEHEERKWLWETNTRIGNYYFSIYYLENLKHQMTLFQTNAV